MTPFALRTDYAFTARVALAPAITIGQCPQGLRRYIPIVGGEVDGPLLGGTVIAAGGDLQTVRADEVLAVDANYLIRTTDGVLVIVTNRGLRFGPEDTMARLGRGEPVAPQDYYFRTAAQLEAPLGSRYEWLNKALFAATAEREAAVAIIHFHRML